MEGFPCQVARRVFGGRDVESSLTRATGSRVRDDARPRDPISAGTTEANSGW